MLLYSTAAAAQWIPLNSGSTESLNELFFPVSDTGYVAGDNGTILKTTDGGINWINLNTGWSVDFHELYFISAEEGWVVGDSGSVCHTVNGGAAWNCTFQDSAASINLHSVFAFNSNSLLVGGTKDPSNGYIARTTNGGLTWQEAYIESYIWDIDIKKIGMVNNTTGYAATRGYVLKTTDSGANWYITDTASVHAGLMFHVLEDLAFFADNDTVYTCGWYDGYFGSTINGGSTWQHDISFQYQNYNMDFINPLTGYVGGWGNMRKTTDGGITFVDASGGSNNLLNDIYSIDFTDEWTGYACGAGGKILKTSNGGAASVSETVNPMSGIYLNPNPTDGKIYFSCYADAMITDVTGQKTGVHKNTNLIDLAGLSNGIYFITLTGNNGQVKYRGKIVKK